LSNVEDVVPESINIYMSSRLSSQQAYDLPSFKVGFHLGEVEVRPLTTLDQFLGVVEEVQGEIKDGGRACFTINEDMLFNHMPATGTKKREGISRSESADRVFSHATII
jgi:hypothetical protein